MGLRELKKMKTRQAIADCATGMFIKRGFDHVTVAEVAEAADVSEKTVFNYFTTKEDLFFDDVALDQVVTLGEVRPGKWFFDYAADRVYFQDDPTNRKVEISVTRHAFQPTAINVTIRGVIIEKYANPAQFGAVEMTNRSGWTLEATEVRLNHGSGIRIGPGARILRNNIHHNGRIGINGGPVSSVLIEGNEIAFNNTRSYDVGVHAGGAKITGGSVGSSNIVWRGNWVHDNTGHGLWMDTYVRNVTFEGNTIENNSSGGIFYETSWDGLIRNNVVRNNAAENCSVSASVAT